MFFDEAKNGQSKFGVKENEENWAKLSLWTGHVRGKWDRVHVGTRITGLTSRQ